MGNRPMLQNEVAGADVERVAHTQLERTTALEQTGADFRSAEVLQHRDFQRLVQHAAQVQHQQRVDDLGRVGAPGPGTGLSGGAIPRAGGVTIGFSRMNRILEIDLDNERAVAAYGSRFESDWSRSAGG